VTPESFLQIAGPLPEPMLLLTGGGLILAGNQAAAARLGAPAAGRPLADLVTDTPADVSGYLWACARTRSLALGALTLRAGGAYRAEGTLVRPKSGDGDALVMLRLLPKEPAVAQFVALNQQIAALNQEIQRRKQAEDDARRQEERLRVTLLSIGDAVIVTDPAGAVTAMNPVAEALTGWAAADAAGRPLEEVFRIVNESTRAQVENPAHRALREGVIVGLANHTLLIARDGTERPIDDSGAPVRDAAGGVVGAVLVFRDITDRKQAEAALRRAEEQFHTMADNIPQLAWMTRADGHIFWYNRRWYDYTGTTFAEMEGWGWQSVHDPAELPRVVDKFTTHVARGEPWEDTFPLRRRDGAMRWHLSRAMPMRDAAGAVVGWFGTNTDITDQREADRRKDEFLATLAHELRNPLAPMRNGLHAIKTAGADAATFAEAHGMMERQLGHMVRLIDDLIDVSRISRGKLDLKRERVELATVVRNAVETARPLIEQEGHHLAVDVPPAPVYVDADVTRLSQVFANLLNNAAKFTARGGRLRLAVGRHDGDTVVTVRDNGVGIPAPVLPRVFDMFTQVDCSLEKAKGGLGIGLTLVKRLVELHGGAVEARSDGDGLGSEFVVRLPAAPAAAAESEPEVVGAPGPAARRRVLVVDDNRDSAVSLAMVLDIMGNDTRTAYDGLEALEVAETFRPEVVLLDIGMPKLNGYDTARRLRAEPWGKHVLLVAQTGWGQEDDKRKSRDAGFDHHLVKPVDPAALEQLLAGLPAKAE